MRAFLLIVAILIMAGCAAPPPAEETTPQQKLAIETAPSAEAPTTPTPTTTPTPPKAAWPIGMASTSGSRFAGQETSLTPTTVSRLGVAWSFETDGALTGTPTVKDGRVFAASWKGFVYALDEETGAQVWRYENGAQMDAPVTLWEDLAIVGDAHGQLTALNQSTGQEVWRIVADATKSAHIYATPVPHEGTLFVGIASDQESIRIHGDAPLDFRGAMLALDARTGQEKWRTMLAPENHTGAPVWGTPVVAAELGLLIFGTGNAYTEPASNMTDSIIALDLQTGRVAWWHQATTNDVFTQAAPTSPDWDFGSTPSLFGDGLVGLGQKSSVYWTLDAATGKVARKIGSPQSGEGIIAGSASAEGRVIVAYATLNKISAYDTTGAMLWNHNTTGGVYSAPALARGLVFAADTKGNVVALDAASGAALWNATVGPVFGGLSIANGKLFVPTVEGGFLGAKGRVVAFGLDGQTAARENASAPSGTTIRMRNFAFEPTEIVVLEGTDIIWVNEDATLHTATSADGAFDITLPNATPATRAFVEEGEYVIYCKPHASRDPVTGAWSGMTMKVIVEGG